jgi:hypothetical protein
MANISNYDTALHCNSAHPALHLHISFRSVCSHSKPADGSHSLLSVPIVASNPVLLPSNRIFDLKSAGATQKYTSVVLHDKHAAGEPEV